MSAVRILIDYRPALRERTGVGEYVHQLACALARERQERPVERQDEGATPSAGTDRLDIFTSSWKDRPSPKALAELGAVNVVDRRLPVRLLNLLWHRLELPPVELLAGRRYDVVHSPHPLLLPARRAAQVVTIHDLDFLLHPERTAAEIRRDYSRLAADHARRADGIIVPSAAVGRLVEGSLGISATKISVCPHGVPEWKQRDRVVPGNPAGRYLLFLGTLEPRKNVPGLLDAYARLLSSRAGLPPLVIAGGPTEAAAPWIEAMRRPPLAGNVDYRGYVPDTGREELLLGARLLVLPSFDEGFGLPVLEAMSLGVPVVASGRGALPEVAGGTAVLVDPDDALSIAGGIEGVLDDPGMARQLAERGLARAATFTWRRTAELTREAYARAIERFLTRRK